MFNRALAVFSVIGGFYFIARGLADLLGLLPVPSLPVPVQWMLAGVVLWIVASDIWDIKGSQLGKKVK